MNGQSAAIVTAGAIIGACIILSAWLFIPRYATMGTDILDTRTGTVISCDYDTCVIRLIGGKEIERPSNSK